MCGCLNDSTLQGATSDSRSEAGFANSNVGDLAAVCYADLFRRVREKVETKAERLVIDLAAMPALPAGTFEARRVAQTAATSLSLVRFDCNKYSGPTAYAHHDVTALGGIEEVRLVVGTETVPTHPRCWGKEHLYSERLALRHYCANTRTLRAMRASKCIWTWRATPPPRQRTPSSMFLS